MKYAPNINVSKTLIKQFMRKVPNLCLRLIRISNRNSNDKLSTLRVSNSELSKFCLKNLPVKPFKNKFETKDKPRLLPKSQYDPEMQIT